MTFPEVMFYAEAEGLLPTRAGRINAVIKDLKEDPHPEITFARYREILRNHDLDYDYLTEREKRYIDASVC